MSSKLELLKDFFKNKVIEIKDVTLKSGIKSPYYCDFRKVMNYPKMFDTVINSLIKIIDSSQLQYDIVSGVPLGAVPFGSVIANRFGCKQIMVRDKQKSYGNNNVIEGVIESSNRVLVIEDVITTGNSCLEVIKKIQNNGGIVTDVVCIYNRCEEGNTLLNENGIKLHSLFQFNDIVSYIERADEYSHSDLEKIKFYHEKRKVFVG